MRLHIAAAGYVLFLSLATNATADEITHPAEPAPESYKVIDSYQSGEEYEVNDSQGSIESAEPGIPHEGCNACGGVGGCSICNGGTVCGGGCNTCGPPACGVCGTAQCWDCSFEEGIDIDSLTIAAQSKSLYEASKARIIVICPEATGVSLLDQKMTTLGEKRSFLVDVNDRDKVYKYEVKVDVIRGGKKYFKKLKIEDLRAGMILTVAVEAPPYVEGAPVVLAVEAKADAPGGKPPEDKKDDADDKEKEEDKDGADDDKEKEESDDKEKPAVARKNASAVKAIR